MTQIIFDEIKDHTFYLNDPIFYKPGARDGSTALLLVGHDELRSVEPDHEKTYLSTITTKSGESHAVVGTPLSIINDFAKAKFEAAKPLPPTFILSTPVEEIITPKHVEAVPPDDRDDAARGRLAYIQMSNRRRAGLTQ
jgi:hypothetical protein